MDGISLRSNLSAHEPEKLWQFYIQLTQVEAAFKDLKDDLALRPVFHQLENRIEAHIFVSFLAYCLHAHLRAGLRPLAPGLTPRSVLEKFAAMQMLDVHFPTTDGYWDVDLPALYPAGKRPEDAPGAIENGNCRRKRRRASRRKDNLDPGITLVQTFCNAALDLQRLTGHNLLQLRKSG